MVEKVRDLMVMLTVVVIIGMRAGVAVMVGTDGP